MLATVLPTSLSQWIHSLNLLDWALVTVIVISAVMGFIRGIIRSLFSLGGLIAGAVLAGWYCQKAGIFLERWISTPLAARAVGFVSIFLVVFLAAILLGRCVRGACSAIGLGFADRAAGAGFGVLRAYLFVAAMLIPFAPYLAETEAAKTSVLLPCFLTGSHGISFVLPRDLKQQIVSGIQRLDAQR